MERARWLTLLATTLLLVWLNRHPSYPDLAGRLFLFTKQSCRFCKQLAPEWQKFVQALPRDAGVTPVQVQVQDGSDPALALRLGVRGFPTIVRVDSSGARRDFAGPRTAQALLAFALAE